MLGGSPISVPVPPMVEAKLSIIKNGSGLRPIRSQSDKTTGVTSRIVVTLSRNAERSTVINEIDQRIKLPRPPVTFTALTAIYWNTPHFDRIPTTIIMPTSRPTVLWSIAATIWSPERRPLSAITEAPSNVAVVDFTLPLAIATMTPTKMDNAAQALMSMLCLLSEMISQNVFFACPMRRNGEYAFKLHSAV